MIMRRQSIPTGYVQEIRRWREERMRRLLASSGWLSLIAFGWLRVGANRVGRAADNDIVLEDGPAHVGVVTLDGCGDVHIRVDAGCHATLDDSPVHEAQLFDDVECANSPTLVRFGTMTLYVIGRDGRKGLRVKDDGALARKQFLGLDYFAIDPLWRLVADWVPLSTPRKLRITRRLGTVSVVDVPGKAEFELHGKRFELLPYLERPDGDLFFVLADQTSGKETYGNARFLYAAMPEDAKVILDFNKAHNPPSAFTSYANCPLAPAENTLALPITAGEMRYRGHHH